MNLNQWRDSGDFFEHNGHRIFYRTEGTGDSLVLIHGYPTASWDWFKIWGQLSERFQCITLDMLGFGFSDKPRRPYSIFEQADIFCTLLDRLEISRCHVLSHDYGDTVAQELMARQLEGVLNFEILSLNLLNGGLFPETHRAVLAQKMLLGPLGGLLVRVMGKGHLAKNLTGVFGPNTPPSEAELDAFWELMNINDGKRVQHRLMQYIAERRQNRERWLVALQQATIPMRLIDGMLDPVSGAHMVERYEELIPNPDVVKLMDIGHYPQVEAPQQVLASLLLPQA